MTPSPRIPSPEGLNEQFYAQIHDGVLRLQCCSSCGRFRHPPRYYCPACASGSFDWVVSPGRGRLFSWTVTHMPFDKGWASEVPYATAVVELDEGVRLIGAISSDDLEVGLPVVAELSPPEEGFTFIAFRRA